MNKETQQAWENLKLALTELQVIVRRLVDHSEEMVRGMKQTQEDIAAALVEAIQDQEQKWGEEKLVVDDND